MVARDSYGCAGEADLSLAADAVLDEGDGASESTSEEAIETVPRADASDGVTQHQRRDVRWSGAQRIAMKDDEAWLARHARTTPEVTRLKAKGIARAGGVLGEGCQTLRHAGRSRFQKREYLVTQPGTRARGVGVGVIGPPLPLGERADLFGVATRDREHGADEADGRVGVWRGAVGRGGWGRGQDARWVDRAEALDGCAAEETHEDGLGLIAGVVGGGDGVAGVGAGEGDKGGVALAAGKGLEVAAGVGGGVALGQLLGMNLCRHVFHAAEVGEFAGLCRVGAGEGRGAEVVDDVGDDQAARSLRGGNRGGQRQDQGGRVGAAGAGQERSGRSVTTPRLGDGAHRGSAAQLGDKGPVHRRTVVEWRVDSGNRVGDPS